MKQIVKTLLLSCLLSICMFSSVFAGNITVLLDGTSLPLSAPAVIQNDRVLVPMRSIMEALDYEVVWHQDTYTVEAKKESTTLFLTIDNPAAKVNGQAIYLDAAATLMEDTTMVPLRFVATHSGATVVWDEMTSTVSITTKPAEITTSDETAVLSDSVVYIQTNKMQGSGVVLSSDGLIATNFHVIERASAIQFIFHNNEIYQGKATIVGIDPTSDIAILKIDKTGLIPAETETTLQKGETVTAIGSPGGVRNVLTNGIIKGFDQDMIDTTAPIAHGSSGGGLFNGQGKLIGITSAYGENQYLSIPISNVLAVPRDLSFPLSTMKDYAYHAVTPKNLRYHIEDNYAYVSWSPVYDADFYYVYLSYTPDGPYKRLRNNALGGDAWYWGFPHSFGISINENHTAYLKVSAVKDGVETAKSEVLKVSF